MSNIKILLKKIKFIYIPWHWMRVEINKQREKRKKAAYDKYGLEALKKISAIIISNSFNIACTEGTLLGLVRDGNLIPWDDDLDFVIIDDGKIPWDKLEKALISNGFWKYREQEYEGRLVAKSYKYKNVLCDFTSWPMADGNIQVCYGCYEFENQNYNNGVEAYYRVWDIEIPAITGIETKTIQNIEIPIPLNSEKLLAALYGQDWQTPNANYKPDRIERKEKFKFTYFNKSKKQVELVEHVKE